MNIEKKGKNVIKLKLEPETKRTQKNLMTLSKSDIVDMMATYDLIYTFSGQFFLRLNTNICIFQTSMC